MEEKRRACEVDRRPSVTQCCCRGDGWRCRASKRGQLVYSHAETGARTKEVPSMRSRRRLSTSGGSKRKDKQRHEGKAEGVASPPSGRKGERMIGS